MLRNCVVLLVVGLFPVFAQARPDWCKVEPSTEESTSVRRAFPRDELFGAPIADMKQPRFYVTYRRTKFKDEGLPSEGQGRVIDNVHVALGDTFDLWTYRRPDLCRGFQFGVEGGAFAEFNLELATIDLINTDYSIGSTFTFVWEDFSGRVRLYHQSSHLGDEFLRTVPDVERRGLSFEVIDMLGAYGGDWGRVYLGGGYIFHTETGLDPWILQVGGDVNYVSWKRPRITITLLGSTDLQFWSARDMSPTFSVKTGAEFAAPAGREFRLLFAYQDGYTPFGQFFVTERLRNAGIEFQFEF